MAYFALLAVRGDFLTIKGSANEITDQVNRLHAEISTLVQNNIAKGIKAGELLTEVKFRVGHGGWRGWIAKNLSFSYRTAARYMQFHNHKAELQGVKNVREAQALLTVGHKKEKGDDAVGADYKRIRKELVRPIRLARRNLHKLSYEGDSPQTLDDILKEMLSEAEGIVADLREILE